MTEQEQIIEACRKRFGNFMDGYHTVYNTRFTCPCCGSKIAAYLREDYEGEEGTLTLSPDDIEGSA
jgi:transcription elongation factor Elf1